MRWIFFITIGMILTSLVSAELIINNVPQISQKINEEKIYQISLKNTFNFELSDFQFSNTTGFIFPSNFTLPKNSTQNLEFKVKYTNSFHGNLNSKVSFKFPVDIPEETTTYNIDITNGIGGLSQDYIVIRQGDTIIWKNTADGTRAITSALFYQEIPVNQTFQYTFSNIGTVNYQVLISGLAWHTGIVEVINKTSEQKAHNPSYDKTITFNMNIAANPTNISTDASKTDFEIEYGTFKKGLLTIENTGNQRAEIINIKSTSNWVSFNKNNIDINKGEEDWIEYTITPQNLGTNDTDKTYNITMSIKASNSDEKNISLSVYIPHKEISNSIGDSDIDLLNWLENVYCPSHPSSFLCDPSFNSTNGTVVYKDVEIPINLSANDFYETLKRLQRLEDSNSRTSNDIDILIEDLKSKMPQILATLNNSLITQQNNEKSAKTWSDVRWIMGFFLFIAFLIWMTFRIINKKADKKNLMEGRYNYKT